MSFATIEGDELARVTGGDVAPGETTAAAGIQAAGQIASTLIQVVGPTVVRSFAGGLSSLCEGILHGSPAPLGQMCDGFDKGMAAEIGGPVTAQYSPAQYPKG